MSLFPRKDTDGIRLENILKYLGILLVILLVTYSYQEMKKWVKRNVKGSSLAGGNK
ncbi:ECU04_0123 [Encephalitozoon cuniculi GB-M1]|uniref:ECU04_0123 protein n=1 Tax=Encephalitozoon cuniculi (strain GB-M1) TaxID=284813 RepID=A0A1T5PD65_ENCCU|nr:uncharacterized protein ECU04_0123 [Encephalitozoon cuniculi GB-M1]UYI27385.1 hypothetical protein J0A71_06g12520 [Encephalitozoon cuniculi]SKD10692.1 ECU04_0123 [Encephalitozoon cuniculi GB-M1]